MSRSAVIADDRLQPGATGLAPVLARLAAIPPGKGHVVTACIRLEPDDRWNQKYLIELKRRIQELEQRGELAGLDHATKAAVQRDLERIVAQVERPATLPAARGLFVCACEGLQLFTAVPLPRVHRPRVVLDDTPWLLELAAAASEDEAALVVVLDRTHARFVKLAAGEAQTLAAFELGLQSGGKFRPDREDAPGTGERRFHSRLMEERHRHYASIVHEVEALCRREPIGALVLAGPDDHVSALARFLPPRLADRLAGTLPLNPTSVTLPEIEREAGVLLARREAAQAARLAANIESAIGEGWATRGPAETLRALGRGQLRTLWASDGLALSGWRCSGSGRLMLDRDECTGEGEPLPVRDLVDEAVEEALRQGIDVVVVHDAATALAADGLAGLLRFRT